MTPENSGGRTWNILFCGVGGQGVLKAADICGAAALLERNRVKKSEVHGMSQRGGSVESLLRFGEEVHSPLIPKGQADFIVCFDEIEGERYRDFLKPDGILFDRHLAAARKVLRDKRLVNTFCLGALSRYLPLKRESWIAALEANFSKYVPENKDAFAQRAQHDLE